MTPRGIYEKRRRHEMRMGNPRRVPALGTQRRLRALMAIGWSTPALAEEGGWTRDRQVQNLLYSRQYVYRQTARRVAELYERLCMTPGPSEHTRRIAKVEGWPSPLSWDDIDRDDTPRGLRRTHTEYDGRDLIDPATILRLLAGDRVPANAAERDEAMRRWRAMGKPEKALCEIHGWQAGRYGREDKSA